MQAYLPTPHAPHANALAPGPKRADSNAGPAPTPNAGAAVQHGAGMLGAPRWLASLHLVTMNLGFARRTVAAGEMIQVAGDVFTHLQIVNVGTVKTVHLTASGREQIVGLHFRGDWVGLDALASGRFACDAYAMEPSEIWSVCYTSVLGACGHIPELNRTLHIAMGDELRRHHEWRLALGMLSAEGRVAYFLRFWVQALSERNLRSDQLALPLTRADIGSYLGLTLETVSRALGQLSRCGVIRFEQQGRRNIAIPSVEGLIAFIEHDYNPNTTATLQ